MGTDPTAIIVDRNVEMEEVASIEDLAGFLMNTFVEVQHRDTDFAEKLCLRKFFGKTESGTHHLGIVPVPGDVEPPTGTDKRKFVDLDSEFCR